MQEVTSGALLNTTVERPQTLVLFGKSGVGKNFIESLLETNFGFHFYDALKILLKR